MGESLICVALSMSTIADLLAPNRAQYEEERLFPSFCLQGEEASKTATGRRVSLGVAPRYLQHGRAKSVRARVSSVKISRLCPTRPVVGKKMRETQAGGTHACVLYGGRARVRMHVRAYVNRTRPT